jgi:hypothetical protein
MATRLQTLRGRVMHLKELTSLNAQSINWKPSMPVFSKVMIFTASKSRNVKGFSILELVVASSVALTILGVSLGMLSEQRRWVLGDQTRATANDGLRLASDLIGQDIKQAGERLESDTFLPGISIIPGASAGLPSTLVLQRQLLTEKLPVCQTISANSTSSTIDIAVVTAPTVANCVYSYSAPPAGELTTALTTLQPDDDLRSWRTFRCTQDSPAANGTDPCTSTNSATAWAYIHDPKTNQGEFFRYSVEEKGSCVTSTAFLPSTARICQKIRRADSTPWKYTYTYTPSDPSDPDNLANPLRAPSAQPQLYLLEERRYFLEADIDTARTDDYVLKLSVNRQEPKRIANQLSNFQVWSKVPTAYTSAPFSAPGTWGCGAGGATPTSPNPTVPTQWYCTGFNFNNTITLDPASRFQYIKDWQDLQGVRISLTGILTDQQLGALTEDQKSKVDPSNPTSPLKLISEFFPRNVASR